MPLLLALSGDAVSDGGPQVTQKSKAQHCSMSANTSCWFCTAVLSLAHFTCQRGHIIQFERRPNSCNPASLATCEFSITQTIHGSMTGDPVTACGIQDNANPDVLGVHRSKSFW